MPREAQLQFPLRLAADSILKILTDPPTRNIVTPIYHTTLLLT